MLTVIAVLASVAIFAAFVVMIAVVPCGSMIGRGSMHGVPGAVGGGAGGTVVSDGAALIYAQHCATCHGGNRDGGVGPPLVPATLTRDDTYYFDVIANGVPRTAMPAWSARGLSDEQIAELVAFLRTAP